MEKSLSQDEIFHSTINNIIKEYSITEIVETGTCRGTGSTIVFAKTNLPVVTMDCDINNIIFAKKFLKDYPNVEIRHALSLDRFDLIGFILEDKWDIPEGIQIDSTDPIGFYLNEVDRSVEEEDILFDLINNDKKQIIFLDSAGGVGWLEFIKVMELKTKFLHNKILIMDDAYHVKHYRSIKELEKLGYKVEYFANHRNAYTAFKVL